MELVKLSEAYTLTDNTDNWITTGTVTIETNGTLNINSNTTFKATDLGFPENQWGGMYYQRSAEGKVNVSYNFESAYKEDYVDYCEELINQIIEAVTK